MAKEQYPQKGYREVALKGRLRTADPPTTIAPEDFQVLKNYRYNRGSVKSIGGQTKINTTPTATTGLKSGIQYRKDYPSAETHLIAGTTSAGYDNTTAIPDQGNFSALYTPTGSGNPRFSLGPNGSVAMCNGTDTFLWYGDETPVGGFLDWDSVSDSYKYDWLEQISNTKTADYATLHRYADTADANTVFMINCDGTNGAQTFTDQSANAHAITVNGHTNTNNSFAQFGDTSAYFDGTNDDLQVGDHADFDFSSGNFTIDFWVYKPGLQSTLPAGTYYYQDNGGGVGTSMRVKISGTTLSLDLDDSTIISATIAYHANSAAFWNHIAIVGQDDGTDVNYMIFVNGYMRTYVTSATEPGAYSGDVFIGAAGTGTDEVTGYIDEYRVSNTPRWTANFTPPTRAYGSGNITALYIACPLPAKGFKFYVGTANTANAGASTSTATMAYWDGSSWVDTTLSGVGTIPLDATESWTFTDTASLAKQKNIDDVISYWYKIEILECDITTTLYQVTADCSMQQLKDLWDGVYRKVNSFTVFSSSVYQDFTPHVLEPEIDTANDGTYAKLGGLTFATDYLYVADIEQLRGIKVSIQGGFINTNECTLAVEYWDGGGDGWVPLTVSDGTTGANISFSQTGTVFWDAPAKTAEFKRSLAGVASKWPIFSPPQVGKYGISSDTYLSNIGGPSTPITPVDMYFYRFSFTGNGTTSAFPAEAAAAGVHVYNIETIPAPVDARGYKFSFEHDASLFLCNNVDAEPNAVIYSAFNRPQVFNGEESGKLYFGDSTGVVAGCSFSNQFGANHYKQALIFKETETWKIKGEYPYEIHNVSAIDGCVAPESVSVGEIEIAQGVRRKVAVWVAQRGVVISDGNFVKEISTDIRDLFDPQHDNYLGASVLPTLHGRIDPVFNEYRLVVPDSTEWVYDFTEGKWYKADRGSGARLDGCIPVFNTAGVSFMYGFTNAGYVMRLDNGTTFATDSSTNDITSTVRLADIALHNSSIMYKSRINYSTLLIKAKTNTSSTVSETRYVDGETSGTSISTVDPTKSGYVYTQGDIHGEAKTGVFHSPEWSITTDDETIGCEPVLWGCNYTVYLREK